jgi:hypothetical protein
MPRSKNAIRCMSRGHTNVRSGETAAQRPMAMVGVWSGPSLYVQSISVRFKRLLFLADAGVSDDHASMIPAKPASLDGHQRSR